MPNENPSFFVAVPLLQRGENKISTTGVKRDLFFSLSNPLSPFELSVFRFLSFKASDVVLYSVLSRLPTDSLGRLYSMY